MALAPGISSQTGPYKSPSFGASRASGTRLRDAPNLIENNLRLDLGRSPAVKQASHPNYRTVSLRLPKGLPVNPCDRVTVGGICEKDAEVDHGFGTRFMAGRTTRTIFKHLGAWISKPLLCHTLVAPAVRTHSPTRTAQMHPLIHVHEDHRVPRCRSGTTSLL